MKNYIATALTLLGLTAGITGLLWTVNPKQAAAHCQVPCGIYDDSARITRLKEDAATIAKAIDNIQQLSGSTDAVSINQMIRWVNTKEQHASHIISVVSEYFLTQKVKPVAKGTEGYEAYLQKLADHHGVMSAAMKTKQKPEAAALESLNRAIGALAGHYK